MTRRIREEHLQAIAEVVRQHPEGMTVQQIHEEMKAVPPRRTLQYRLKSLVDDKRLIMKGSGRWTRYSVPRTLLLTPTFTGAISSTLNVHPIFLQRLSEPGTEIREIVRRSPELREPVGYDRTFLDSYRPDDTFYLSQAERELLREIGSPKIAVQPAGTYARQLMNRLLIDLSWNSSRLEGNTYSLLNTTRLLDLGEETEGKERNEAQMILNHKAAIEFLIDSAQDIGFNRYTILNLHALLAENLLAEPDSGGRLRQIGVGIGGSVFHPLEVPQLIGECFDQILATASMIADPFEQAFFAMVHLPYLQPFDDVNKRVSRLAVNIPLVKGNLSPLSFEDVPQDLYIEAMLGVYELNRTELLRDVFIRAYRRSAARYVAVQQSLGEPDPFRTRHRTALREVVSEVIDRRMNKKQAATHVAAWTQDNIDQKEGEMFRQVSERELLSLHEGNFARYRIRPSEFAAWQENWIQ